MKIPNFNRVISPYFVIAGLLSHIAGSFCAHSQQVLCGFQAPSGVQNPCEWFTTNTTYKYDIAVIPLAFHIIRDDNGNGDVDDETIYRQFCIINRDFRTALQGLDSLRFQFTLHSIDRTNNSSWADHTIGGSHSLEMRAALAIDPAHVLNIYICQHISSDNGDPAGYGHSPSADAPDSYTHGVVIIKDVLPGGSDPYWHEGDVAAHEIGHAFGLLHPWDYGCSNNLSDCVADTPPQNSWNAQCNYFFDPCSTQTPTDPRNIMDYTDDSCKDRFTVGQHSRMFNQLFHYRPSMFGNIRVSLNQKKDDGSTMVGSTIGRWEGCQDGFVNYIVPPNPDTRCYQDGTIEVLRGMTEIVEIPVEKYYKWDEAFPNEINHHVFTISPTTLTLTSRFARAYTASAISNLIDLNMLGGELKFKDPWYRDLTDTYGIRNRGTGAALRNIVPAYNNLSKDSSHQGVNSNLYPSPGHPYYTISTFTPQNIVGYQNWKFVGWSGNNVFYENRSAATTAITFLDEDAVARADFKAHLISG